MENNFQLPQLYVTVEEYEEDEEIDEPVLERLNNSIKIIAENEMKMLKEMIRLAEELSLCQDEKEVWIENSFVFNV
jgi:hypothetical protein